MAQILLTVDLSDDAAPHLDAFEDALAEAGFRAMETARTYALEFPPDIDNDDLYSRVVYQGPAWYVKAALEQGAEAAGGAVTASYLIAGRGRTVHTPESIQVGG
jgi:predicted ATPase